jgi:hypothetical protein
VRNATLATRVADLEQQVAKQAAEFVAAHSPSSNGNGRAAGGFAGSSSSSGGGPAPLLVLPSGMTAAQQARLLQEAVNVAVDLLNGDPNRRARPLQDLHSKPNPRRAGGAAASSDILFGAGEGSPKSSPSLPTRTKATCQAAGVGLDRELREVGGLGVEVGGWVGGQRVSSPTTPPLARHRSHGASAGVRVCKQGRGV